MRTVATAALLALLALPANAQTTAQPTPQPPAASATTRKALLQVERHIAALHKRLAITPAEEPQWTAFANVMRQNAQEMEQSYAERDAKPANLSAIEDMRSYAAVVRLHAASVDRLVPVFETLYAAMTPEQRTLADKTFQKFQRGPGHRPG